MEGNLNGFDCLSNNFDQKTDSFIKADLLTSSFLTTTTNTTETQTSEMNLYRRASYLEEYVSEKVKQLEKVIILIFKNNKNVKLR